MENSNLTIITYDAASQAGLAHSVTIESENVNISDFQLGILNTPKVPLVNTGLIELIRLYFETFDRFAMTQRTLFKLESL